MMNLKTCFEMRIKRMSIFMDLAGPSAKRDEENELNKNQKTNR